MIFFGQWLTWAFLIGSTLILANTIAFCLSLARAKRVSKKAHKLSQTPGKTTPVTVVTGFLGSGKTVLLNRLLSESTLRICVIENEKGAISIDHSLLKKATAGVIVLKNGCMCCSADGAGESELERVLDRLTELSSGVGVDGEVAAGFDSVDYVVIETSGLADPGPILQTFFRRDMQSRFTLDGVIAVVDAKHVSHHLCGNGFFNLASEAGRQVGVADVVLLNKVDIASLTEIDAARSAIRAANPTAQVIECSHCVVDANALLSKRFFDVSHCKGLFPSNASSVPEEAAAVHVDGVTAITLETVGAVHDVSAVKLWLQEFVRLHWQNVYRIKGLLWVHLTETEDMRLEPVGRNEPVGRTQNSKKIDADLGSSDEGNGTSCDSPKSDSDSCSGDHLFVIQGVHAEVHGAVLSDLESHEIALRGAAVLGTFRTGVVIIGRRLDETTVRASFAAACDPTGIQQDGPDLPLDHLLGVVSSSASARRRSSR